MTDPAVGQVECYSGHTYAQEPRAVIWQGRRYLVAAVLQRWRTPGGPAFWIETETGERFELHYTEETDTWRIRPLMADDEGSPQSGTPSTGVHHDNKEVPTR